MTLYFQLLSKIQKLGYCQLKKVLEERHGYYQETALLTATWNKKNRTVEVLLRNKVKYQTK